MALADAVSQSTVARTIQPVENRLIQCRQFRRPSNRELLASQTNIQEVIVDASEQAMKRAKKTDTASPTNHLRPKVGYRFQSRIQTEFSVISGWPNGNQPAD